MRPLPRGVGVPGLLGARLVSIRVVQRRGVGCRTPPHRGCFEDGQARAHRGRGRVRSRQRARPRKQVHAADIEARHERRAPRLERADGSGQAVASGGSRELGVKARTGAHLRASRRTPHRRRRCRGRHARSSCCRPRCPRAASATAIRPAVAGSAPRKKRPSRRRADPILSVVPLETMRPSFITATLSQTTIASSWSWVT